MLKQVLVILGLISVIGAGGYLFIVQTGVLKRQDSWETTDPGMAVVSSRGHFRGGELVPGRTPYEYELVDVLGGQPFWSTAPDDILVVIHGFNNSAEKAAVKFRTAAVALRSCGYRGLLAGFSWDADTQQDPFGATGYREGRQHAIGNGTKLARFLADCRSSHPGARLHVIGYSMGARVALEALVALENDLSLAAKDFRVDSVHLVGAAVDNEEVELREQYGTAIERRTAWLFNYYSVEDNSLGIFYPLKEGDRALGESDIEHPGLAPANYKSFDVRDELISYDEELHVVSAGTGDNHSGCLGNLSPEGELLDDGIMDIVAAQINMLE